MINNGSKIQEIKPRVVRKIKIPNLNIGAVSMFFLSIGLLILSCYMETWITFMISVVFCIFSIIADSENIEDWKISKRGRKLIIYEKRGGIFAKISLIISAIISVISGLIIIITNLI